MRTCRCAASMSALSLCAGVRSVLCVGSRAEDARPRRHEYDHGGHKRDLGEAQDPLSFTLWRARLLFSQNLSLPVARVPVRVAGVTGTGLRPWPAAGRHPKFNLKVAARRRAAPYPPYDAHPRPPHFRASSTGTAAQTRKSPIPVPPIPDSAGKRGRESPIPDSAGIGNREPPFPDSPGRERRELESGSRLAANREIGDTPLPVCEYSSRDPGLNVALSP